MNYLLAIKRAKDSRSLAYTYLIHPDETFRLTLT